MSAVSRCLFVLPLLFAANESAFAAVLFTEPHLVSQPGGSGSIYLGVNSDWPGGEFLSYDYTGMSFTGVDADVVVTPTPASNVLEAPPVGDDPALLLIGTFDVLASADVLDQTSFDINLTMDPIAAVGSSYDPAINGVLSGSVTAVPEPTAAALALAGAVVLGTRRRRQ